MARMMIVVMQPKVARREVSDGNMAIGRFGKHPICSFPRVLSIDRSISPKRRLTMISQYMRLEMQHVLFVVPLVQECGDESRLGTGQTFVQAIMQALP